MPYIMPGGGGTVCEQLTVFGDDYPTHDGTGVRDYIHVVDLARRPCGGAATMPMQHQRLPRSSTSAPATGYSVHRIRSAAFERANGIRTLPHVHAPTAARAMSPASYADPAKAKEPCLRWQAEAHAGRYVPRCVELAVP